MEAVIVLLGAAVAMLILILFMWAGKVRSANLTEPIIVLEKLVNCRSCDSLIPEGARMCAFCGAVQKDRPPIGPRTN